LISAFAILPSKPVEISMGNGCMSIVFGDSELIALLS
jgi:hypothetical protein